MRSPARFRLAACLLATSAALACSDSTAPHQTAAQIALHFDSIAVQAAAQSQTNSAYSNRTFLATLIEVSAAFGASPASVNVNTASGTEHWKGYEILEHTAPSSSADSGYILLLFRDSDAHTAILAEFDNQGAIQEAGLITGDTILVSPSDGSGSTSETSVGATCGTPSSSLVNPSFGSITMSACNLASFHTSLSLTLPSTTGLDAALTHVTFSNATVAGVRIADEDSGASTQRLVSLLHAANANRRH